MKLETWSGVLALLLACGGDKVTPPPIIGPPPGRPTLPETYRPTGMMAAGNTFVHLFEWKWTDIARECENVLGPAGFHAVQISPPQEHSVEPPNYPWSERYQPVSYSIDKSRSGTRAEFVDMVNRCRAVGVGIYVDAVINHMTNFPSPGVGSNGTAYSKYNYPGLYTQSDFHTPCSITNYNSAANVQDCELFGLPDLATESATVRQKIANYLIMLSRLGVAGFRIDAAKHIQQVDLDEIMKIVNTTLSGEGRALPYWFLEVIAGGGEAIQKRDYYGAGYSSGGASDITEFTTTGVGDKFRPLAGQYVAQLNPNGTPGNQFSEAAWGLMPADKAVIFLENHDTHMHNSNFSYRLGNIFRLANVWLLAQPYGYPSIFSGYAVATNLIGPPSDANGNTKDVVCAQSFETAALGEWVCEHRDPHIRNMVGFRKAVAGTTMANWWDNGANAIAFARGNKGFVVINRESAEVSRTFTTGLPGGTYCNVISGLKAGAACAGNTVTVDAGGNANIAIPAMSAIAIHINQRL